MITYIAKYIVTTYTFISSLTYDHANGDCFLYTECIKVDANNCEECISGEENMIMTKRSKRAIDTIFFKQGQSHVTTFNVAYQGSASVY